MELIKIIMAIVIITQFFLLGLYEIRLQKAQDAYSMGWGECRDICNIKLDYYAWMCNVQGALELEANNTVFCKDFG